MDFLLIFDGLLLFVCLVFGLRRLNFISFATGIGKSVYFSLKVDVDFKVAKQSFSARSC